MDIEKVRAVLPDGVRENVTLSIEDGAIASVSRAAEALGADAEQVSFWPGFIDVHIHGAVGIDVNAADTDGLVEIAKFLLSNGVTAWMPTLVPDSDDNYRRVIESIDRLMEIQEFYPIAQAVGVHYEGAFANEKMCGALRPEYFKTFTGGEVSELPRLKTGVHMITLAPEVSGGIELIHDLRKQSWIVSIGHTNADIGVLDDAFNAGARHLTHFYNAMTGLHHRNVGVVGWALTNPDVTFDIIADGVHVHPRMLEFACRAKSPEKVSLISDSVAPTGLGDGEYEIWGEKVSVVNGCTENERGSIAGSVITMNDAVQRMIRLGFTPQEVSRMASLNPARLLGIDDKYGSIEPGKRADLITVDADGKVRSVMIAGKMVFEN